MGGLAWPCWQLAPLFSSFCGFQRPGDLVHFDLLRNHDQERTTRCFCEHHIITHFEVIITGSPQDEYEIDHVAGYAID